MAYDIGVKLKIDGEKEYRDAINQINLVNKTLDTELKAVTSSFNKNTTAEQKAAAQEETLQKKLANSADKLELIKKGLADATANYDKNSREVQSWTQAMNNAQAEVNKLTNQIDELGDAQEDNSKKTSTFGDVLKANLTSEAIISGVKALASAVKKVGEALVGTVTGVSQYADDLNTLSKVTGLSTDTLQEFQFMSAMVDVDVTTISESLRQMTARMKSAREGTGASAEAFKKLGVRVTNADGTLRDSEEIFKDVIGALSKMENGTERNALAMELFGEGASKLNPLIDAGADTINAYTEQAHEMGYVLSGETLDSVNAVQDNIDILNGQMTAIKNTIGVALAPVVKQITDAFIKWASAVDWEAVGEVIATVFNVIANVVSTAAQAVEYIINRLAEFGLECYNLYNAVSEAIGKIPPIFDGLRKSIENIMNGLSTSAFDWGGDMVKGFERGVLSFMGQALSSVGLFAGGIRSLLHFSRPDKGPLRDYETWMPDFMRGLAKGIEQNSYLVENAMGKVAGAMTIRPTVNGATAGRGGVVVNFGNVTINGTDEAAANNFIKKINRKLGALIT